MWLRCGRVKFLEFKFIKVLNPRTGA